MRFIPTLKRLGFFAKYIKNEIEYYIKDKENQTDIKINITKIARYLKGKVVIQEVTYLNIDYYVGNNQRKTVCFKNEKLIAGSLDNTIYEILKKELESNKDLIGSYEHYRINNCLGSLKS